MENVEFSSQEKSHEKEISLENRVGLSIAELSRSVSVGEIGIIESTEEMSKIVRSTLVELTEVIAKDLNISVEELPFALFVFGSPSRNVMLPNSDLDVGTIFNPDCPADIVVSVQNRLAGLPFDKVDVASWLTLDSMKKENCPSMIEFSKATDAKFVTGNINIQKDFEENIEGTDLLDDKLSRLVTEFGLLHFYDYPSKKTEHGPNLKYDFGASRDIIFLDWYFLIKKDSDEENGSLPFYQKGIDTLFEGNLIDGDVRDGLIKGIEIILLVKFLLVNKSRREEDGTKLYLNDSNLKTAFDEAPGAFTRLGINDSNDLVEQYNAAKKILHSTVEKIYSEVAMDKQDLKEIWDVAESEIDIVRVKEVLDPLSWYTIVPFAIKSKSDEILEYIVDLCANASGYEYVLRIVSQNENINSQIKEKLLQSSLPQKYKMKLINKNI